VLILMVITLLILVLVVATFLIARRLGIGYNPQPTTGLAVPAVKTSRSETTQWRSVKIKSGLICCKNADKLNGAIFFATDAPTLPLASCSEKQCMCKYTLLDDRRDGHDRREATEYSSSLFSLHGKERRDGEDRRTIIA
jgi:hypothetical protein